MSKHEWEPFRAVFDMALDRPITTLTEAQSYLDGGNNFAAIGTLHNFDELHADIQAALWLFKNRRRARSPLH
jgi:hypothetical protein